MDYSWEETQVYIIVEWVYNSLEDYNKLLLKELYEARDKKKEIESIIKEFDDKYSLYSVIARDFCRDLGISIPNILINKWSV